MKDNDSVLKNKDKASKTARRSFIFTRAKSRIAIYSLL